MIEILSPGQQVEIDGEISGRLAHVRICPDGLVLYAVEWWNGRTQESDVFDAARIEPLNPNWKTVVGFKPC